MRVPHGTLSRMARTTPARGRTRGRTIPRSCSDVYRLWAAVGLGIVVAIVLEIAVDLYAAAGFEQQLTPAQQAVREDFGSNLIAFLGFAVAYLVLGIRAFAGCDRRELVRRVRGRPSPATTWKRWVLAGGGGILWPVAIAVVAFSTVVTVVLSRGDAPPQVLVLAGITVLFCLMIITFSYALHYARRDIERGGLLFSGDEPASFSDYVYLAVGISVTFGTTDTSIVTRDMRRTVSVHSVMAWLLNTVVIAVTLSVIVN